MVESTTDPEPDLEPLLPRIHERLPGMLGVWLFGSHARGDARPDSAIELAVLGSADLDPVAVSDLGPDLSVLARRDVNLIDLQRAPTALCREVVREGRLVACHDPVACEAFAADCMSLSLAAVDEPAVASSDHEPAKPAAHGPDLTTGSPGAACWDAMATYMLETVELPIAAVDRVLSSKLSTKVMKKYVSTAQQIRNEGIQKGRADTLLRQVTHRFGAAATSPVEARIRTASIAELDRLAERVLDAATIDDLFAE